MNDTNPSAAPLGKQALIVLGMHRSGTSATTGALRCLGVQLGPRLYAGHAGINAKGYFEHAGVADTDDEVLYALGSCWDDILPLSADWWQNPALHKYAKKIKRYIAEDFSQAALWSVKDPRICRLLPWWLQLLREEAIVPACLIVLRHPMEVCRSLRKRDGFSNDKGLLLWIEHYLQAERWSRELPRAVMRFDDLLADPVAAFAQVEAALPVRFPVSSAAARDCLQEFVSKDLRHLADDALPESELAAIAQALHDGLAQTASTGTFDTAAMDALAARFERLRADFPPLLVEHIRRMSHQYGGMSLVMNRIFRSYSAFLGKPVRFLERIVGRDV